MVIQFKKRILKIKLINIGKRGEGKIKGNLI